MATFFELLDTVIEETLAMQKVDPATRWATSSAYAPFGPGIPVGDGQGSYPTTDKAMEALATIADRIRANDTGLARTSSREITRLEASLTFGELLPKLMGEPDPTARWKLYRERLLVRLQTGRQAIAHYVPVWLFTRQELAPFNIGPVRFVPREEWLEEIERRRGAPSPWMDEVRRLWRRDLDLADVSDTNVRTVARSVRSDQWVASVTLEGFERAESYRRGLLAIRVALDTLRIVIRPPHNMRIATAIDHGPPNSVNRFSQLQGHDLAHGWSFNPLGVSGAPGLAQSTVTEAAALFTAAGRRIAIMIDDRHLPAGGCPKLSERWFNAVHWYGRASRADMDFIGWST